MNITAQDIKTIAEREGVDREALQKAIASGRVIILKNARRHIEPVPVGGDTTVKVNANIGMSPEIADEKKEVEKAKAAMKAGADTIMDLSVGGDTWSLLKRLLKLEIPLGTVPVYEAALDTVRRTGSILDMEEDALFNVIERQAKMGVDFMTIHAGITKKTLETVDRSTRVTGIVSRGGSLLARWMRHTEKENPLYRDFHYLLELIKDHHVVVSLGDALRPGCIADATDRAQIEELILLGGLVEECRRAGVGVMVEGPGHVPLNEIEANVLLQKKVCKDAPFYVLGPIVTDIAAGYDHIAGAIGGAVAAMHGADFLCYVTPSEHLALPDVEDVRQGVIASKIAAHAADVARGRGRHRDLQVAGARAKLDWEEQFKHLLDPERACAVRGRRHPRDPRVCTMCGDFCSMK
ncbi:MAG: phosphomethylpyrimidine synthase ThiC [Methanobacteriota archaeon]|nr:MAG: phosphomethylpyrimidine synthase ThiC [Euryarchaeota archaeon]